MGNTELLKKKYWFTDTQKQAKTRLHVILDIFPSTIF